MKITPALTVVFAACQTFAAQPLPRSAPEAQGVSSEGVRAFIEASDKGVDTMHSFMLVRHGHVVAECWWKPETAEKPHVLYSLSKSFTMCSAIVQKVTGQTVLDYLRPRLFEPLGIEGAAWSTSPQGISAGGWGLFLKTEDIAKFGQLYLQRGQWNGKQILPAAWVEQATARQVSNGSDPARDWDQGYGFQFWRCRHGVYRGDGAFGQFCLVMPEQDAVVAITADTKDMQAQLNLVWDKLLPAFQKEALPENADGYTKLNKSLAALAVREGHAPNSLKLPGTK